METTIYRVILGLYRDNGKENGNYYIWGYIGVIWGEWKRKWKLLYIGLYWGYVGIMEKKMATTTYRVLLGLCRDNGKENGNYYIQGYIGVI